MSTAAKPGPPWTVLKLLEWSKQFFEERGIESPRLDAELLLAHVLELDRVRLYMEHDRPLLPAELDAYRALVKRRANRAPVAYLTGTRGFWTLDIATDARALVPRPDTEVLVEEALARIESGASVSVLDVGTGTGAIALAIASERSTTRVVATDISSDALALAAQNAATLGFDIDFRRSDLFAELDGIFDLIVSNPPYIAIGATVDAEVGHEPQAALFAGDDGLDVIRRLVADAPAHLPPGGWLVLEHGFDQAPAVRSLLVDAGFDQVATRKDYGGNDRVTAGRRPEA